MLCASSENLYQMKYFFIFISIFLTKTSLGQSTNFGKIPKVVKAAIEKNYEYRNVFYHYFDTYEKGYLIWFYNNSTVHWKLMDKSKVKKSGSFNSSGNFDRGTIYAINEVLNNSITELAEKSDCTHVLDGSTFGYVLTLENKEIVGLNFINTSECLRENKTFIAKDFFTILDFNFKITTAE
jgi:hypothetical protein